MARTLVLLNSPGGIVVVGCKSHVVEVELAGLGTVHNPVA